MVRVETVVVGPLSTNAYVICNNDSCVVVDPGDEAWKIMRVLRGRRVLAVIATHLHFDHVGAVRDIVELTGAPFMVHRLDWELRDAYAELAMSWGFKAPVLPKPTFVDEGFTAPLGL
ncbi:MAG: MBL fold metallo-hydrolase, partial [Vulcanisaeta sp.]